MDPQHLKIKGQDICLTKNYCLTISIQKISSILDLYQHAKNQFTPTVHSPDSQFQSHITRLTTPIFDHAHPKNFKSAYDLCGFMSACKKSVHSICPFWRYSQFQSPDTRLATPMPNQKKFDQHFIFENLYQHAKNMLSGEIFVLEKWLI